MLVQVKGNQPTLLAACVDLAHYCTAAECDVQHDKGHGRVETRTVRTYDVPANWLKADWQPLVQQIVSISLMVECRNRSGGWDCSRETAWWVSTVVQSARWPSVVTGRWKTRIITCAMGS